MATQVTVTKGSDIHAIASKGIAGIPAKRIADYITKFTSAVRFELTIENEVFDVTVVEPVVIPIPAPVKTKARPIAKVTKVEDKKAKILASHAPATVKRSHKKKVVTAAPVAVAVATAPIVKRSHKKKVIEPVAAPVKRSHKKKVVTA